MAHRDTHIQYRHNEPSTYSNNTCYPRLHDDVIKWKHFPRNWPFVRKIHRSPVNFSHKGQWRVALMFSLIYDWINDWANNREAGDLRRQHGHYDVIVMECFCVEEILLWQRQGSEWCTWLLSQLMPRLLDLPTVAKSEMRIAKFGLTLWRVNF